MTGFLLAIIYLAFISLGLPDSLLGAAWPSMQTDFDAPISYAGIVSMIISCGTIVSSLLSDRLIKKLGAGVVTAVSVAMTAVALFCFSFADRFLLLCVFAIPYGLGAGAVDAALNNYVALRYSSRQMSWLHAFWGIGVTISPYIMSYCLTKQFGWQTGYRSVGVVQCVLVAVLIASLPLWKKVDALPVRNNENVTPNILGFKETFRLKGAAFMLLAFLCYCALESTTGLWASSYLTGYRSVSADTAAMFASFFYIGITAGRILCGFVADKIGDRNMIRLGAAIFILGVVLVAIPFYSDVPTLIGLIVIGLGCGPVYPCIIHSTPYNFGAENSQSMVGKQMAFAYIGSTFMPPLFGLMAQYINVSLYPFYLGAFAILTLLFTELLNAAVKKEKLKSAAATRRINAEN